MRRISTACAVSGMLATLAFSANAASAGNLNIHTTMPPVKIATPKAGGNLDYSTGKEVHSYQIGVQSPRDTTGLATGKRQHSPLTITKQTGTSSPQLLDAHWKSENFIPAGK